MQVYREGIEGNVVIGIVVEKVITYYDKHNHEIVEKRGSVCTLCARMKYI